MANWSDPRINAAPAATRAGVADAAFDAGLRSYMLSIYNYMASGVLLTASTTIFDLVNEREVRREVPAGAVVVPGSRPAGSGFAQAAGLHVNAPMIVKYRDDRTDAATALEGALR